MPDAPLTPAALAEIKARAEAIDRRFDPDVPGWDEDPLWGLVGVDVPALLAEVERLNDELDSLRGVVWEYRGRGGP